MTSSPPLLTTSGNSLPLVMEENLEEKETCNGREFAEMPLRSGNERDVRHPGHHGSCSHPRTSRGRGGSRLQSWRYGRMKSSEGHSQSQNKTKEGTQDPLTSLSSTTQCPARASHPAGLG